MKTKLLGILLIGFASIKPVLAFVEVKDSSNTQILIQDTIPFQEDNNFKHGQNEENDQVSKEKNGDTTFITLGKKRIKIFEENGETSVKLTTTAKDQNKIMEMIGKSRNGNILRVIGPVLNLD
jgi:hypothetical protein